MFKKKFRHIIKCIYPSKILLYSILIFSVHNLHGQVNSEYAIEAVFIEKFTHFIEWPINSASISQGDPFFYISVLGKSPFGEILEDIYKEKVIHDKKVKIRYIKSIDELEPSHILFITSSEDFSLNKIIDKVESRPILTIGNTNGYAQRGVIINFFIDDNKIKFEINESAMKKSGLYISYRLLSTAKIVKPIGK